MRTTILMAVALLAGSVVTGVGPSSADDHTYQEIGGQDIVHMPLDKVVRGINNDRLVVGTDRSTGGGFVLDWDTGVYSPIGFSGADINDDGLVVGFSSEVYDHRSASIVADMGDLGGGSTNAFRISNSGVVIGVSQTASGQTRAFAYDLNTGGPMIDLSAAMGRMDPSRANDVNDHGQIVGEIKHPTQATDGFVFDLQDGSFEFLNPPDRSGRVVANGINNHGDVVGEYRDTSDGLSFIRWAANGEYELLPIEVKYPDLIVTPEASAINDAGLVLVLNACAQPCGNGRLSAYDPHTGEITYFRTAAESSEPGRDNDVRSATMNEAGDIVASGGYIGNVTSFVVMGDRWTDLSGRETPPTTEPERTPTTRPTDDPAPSPEDPAPAGSAPAPAGAAMPIGGAPSYTG